MASALTKFTFSCPHCDKVLKTAARPAADKKFKCPACGKAFVPELDDDDDDESSGIQERPALKGKSKAASKTSVNGKARKPARDDDDDDDDRPSKKNAKQKSGSNLLLFGVLGVGVLGLLLACGGLGITAFVWPGFLRSKKTDEPVVAKNDAPKDGDQKKQADPKDNPPQDQNPPVVAGNNNLGHFVLPDADLMVGMNLRGLRDLNQLEKLLKLEEKAPGMPASQKMPAEMKDLLRNSERLVVCMQIPASAFERNQLQIQPFPKGGQPFPRGGLQPIPGGGQFPPGGLQPVPGGGQPFPPGGFQQPGQKPKIVLAMLASTPDVVNKFKSLPALGAEQKLAGKYSVYRPNKAAGDWAEFVACPGDRLLLFCDLNEQEMIGLLDQGAKNQAPFSETARLAQSVEQAHFWAALKFNDKMRQLFQGLDKMAQQTPQLSGMSAALQRSKGAALSIDSVENGAAWKARALVECASAPDALAVRQGGEALKSVLTLLVGMQANAGKSGPPASVTRDLATLAFDNQGVVASVSIQVYTQTLTDLMNPAAAPQRDPPYKDKDVPPKTDNLLPPPTPKNLQFFLVDNLAQGSSKVRGIRLLKGQKILVSAANNTRVAKNAVRNNVDIYVYKGDTSSIKNIIAFDEKPQTKEQRDDQWSKATFVVPETGAYYIQASNKGPGRTFNCPVTIEDITGRPDIPPVTKDKDTPKINVNANRPPAQYVVQNFTRGHTDEKLFLFQPNKVVQIAVQFTAGPKKSADVEITVLKGEKGNDVVARRNGTGPIVGVQFTPGPAEGVYRVRIHNRGPHTALANAVQIVQQR